MRPFRRRLGRYVATFEAIEASMLAELVDQVRHLLANRRAQAPADPLAQITGMSTGPATAPQDPVTARLLPDFHHDDPDLSSGMRLLREPDLIAAKDQAAVALLDSLPRGGGTVRLDGPTAEYWLRALNDLRLALGVRLEITDDDAEPEAATADPGDPTYAMYMTYRWLSAMQDSLVTALMD